MILAFCFFISLAVAVFGAWSDFKSLRIPNEVSLIVFLFFVVGFLYAPADFDPLWQHVSAGILMFFISYIMFIMGMMGGGDSKLASALAFWLGLKNIVVFVFIMSALGGLLGLIALLIKNTKPFKNPKPQTWIAKVQSGKNAIPYGVPIVIGFIVTVSLNDFLQNRIYEAISIFY